VPINAIDAGDTGFAPEFQKLRRRAAAIDQRRPELKTLEPNLAYVEGILTRLYTRREGVDHFLEGLRKAGFE
jgi:hypothetical protein